MKTVERKNEEGTMRQNEQKEKNEKRVFGMVYQTYKFRMRVDEGMCVMIDDLLGGDILRLEEIVEQVVLCLEREKKVKEYFKKGKVRC